MLNSGYSPDEFEDYCAGLRPDGPLLEFYFLNCLGSGTDIDT